MYQPKLTVKTAAELKAIRSKDFPSQVAKIIDHIDPHCRTWIERCPFVVISSTNAAGAMDVSPKGDPPGFVKVSASRRSRYRIEWEITAATLS